MAEISGHEEDTLSEVRFNRRSIECYTRLVWRIVLGKGSGIVNLHDYVVHTTVSSNMVAYICNDGYTYTNSM